MRGLGGPLLRWGFTAIAAVAALTGQWPAALLTTALAIAAWAARP